MEVREGSCRLGLWYVHVTWDEHIVHQVRFHRTGIPGSVPEQITRFLAGKTTNLDPLVSLLPDRDDSYGRIYQAVLNIPYGSVRTYGEVARQAGSNPRTVGQAMSRNITPILIPCHRVVASDGIGGFTPDIWIKEELLRIEANGVKKLMKENRFFQEFE